MDQSGGGGSDHIGLYFTLHIVTEICWGLEYGVEREAKITLHVIHKFLY